MIALEHLLQLFAHIQHTTQSSQGPVLLSAEFEEWPVILSSRNTAEDGCGEAKVQQSRCHTPRAHYVLTRSSSRRDNSLIKDFGHVVRAIWASSNLSHKDVRHHGTFCQCLEIQIGCNVIEQGVTRVTLTYGGRTGLAPDDLSVCRLYQTKAPCGPHFEAT